MSKEQGYQVSTEVLAEEGTIGGFCEVFPAARLSRSQTFVANFNCNGS